MQIVKNDFQVQTNLDQKSQTFGVKDMGKIAHLLISQYTAPIQTLVQEYISNAIDATNEAGNGENIEVNIPNMLNNYTFSVRDYGVGLSKDRIDNIFTQFGGTTKDTSNGQIGGFGIGAKSGLAYADKFYITSFLDGVKTKYMVFKTPNGVELKAVFKEETTEKNGVLVEVETNQSDYNRFKKAVCRMANFLPVRPIINEPIEHQIKLSGGHKVSDNVTLYDRNKLDSMFSESIPKVIINYGGVPYLIAYHDVDEIGNASQLFDFISRDACVVIDCPIGLFMPIQTREQLDYSRDLTKNNLLKVFTSTLMDLQAYQGKLFDNVKTIAEMRNKIKQNYKYFGKHETKKFKGIEISSSSIYSKDNFDILNINRYGKWGRGIVKKVSYNGEKSFEHGARLFYIDVEESEATWKRRVRYELLEKCSEPVVVLRPKFKANKKQMKAFRKVIQELDVRPISELETPPKKAKGFSSYSYTKRENTKVYLNKDYWIDLANNTEKFVYCDEDDFAYWKKRLFAKNGLKLVFSSKTHLKKIAKDKNFTHISKYNLDKLITSDMINGCIAQKIIGGCVSNSVDFIMKNRHHAKGKLKRYTSKLFKYYKADRPDREIREIANKFVDDKLLKSLKKEYYKLDCLTNAPVDEPNSYYYKWGKSNKVKDTIKAMKEYNTLAEVF